jgi:hypothetical protein
LWRFFFGYFSEDQPGNESDDGKNEQRKDLQHALVTLAACVELTTIPPLYEEKLMSVSFTPRVYG